MGCLTINTRVRAIAAVWTSCALAACSQVLDPRGSIGGAEKTILINTLVVMACIVGPIIVATFAFAWWYRAANGRASYRPDWAYSGKLEFVVWAIPALIILFLGSIAWVGSHDLDPARPIASRATPIDVQVVSLDWKWLFIYPGQGLASVNRLVVPVGHPIHFRITSASVMNAFFVPRLGSMIYAMNGMATQLNLLADAPGRYRGLSSHFSGDGFSDMHFTVDAVTDVQFSRWIAGARTSGATLDSGGYRLLSRQGVIEKPFSYRSVEPYLFDAIVTQRIAPAPGPTSRPMTAIAVRTEG